MPIASFIQCFLWPSCLELLFSNQVRSGKYIHTGAENRQMELMWASHFIIKRSPFFTTGTIIQSHRLFSTCVLCIRSWEVKKRTSSCILNMEKLHGFRGCFKVLDMIQWCSLDRWNPFISSPSHLCWESVKHVHGAKKRCECETVSVSQLHTRTSLQPIESN